MAQERVAAAQERAAMQEAVTSQVKALTDLIEELRRDRQTPPARRGWWLFRRSA